MKKIFLSLSVIVLTAIATVGLTTAYFSDTEKSTANTFSAGTIDISINDQNPWLETFALDHMKPGYSDKIDFIIQNFGEQADPVNIYKRIVIDPQTGFTTGAQSQPECEAERGTWDNQQKICLDPAAEDNEIDKTILYNLKVWLYDAQDQLIWQQTIYDQELTVKDAYWDPESGAYSRQVYLGMIPANSYLKVEQSYHMAEATTNWAQGDIMTFDMEIEAEQITGTIALENKIAQKDNQEYWKIIHNDGIAGTLNYNPQYHSFNLNFSGIVPSASSDYTLVAGFEPWNGGETLGSGVSDETGKVSFSEDLELNSHLKNQQIWLVLSADWNETGMTNWRPEQYLFGTGLIWYEDTDL